jgi:hypothetical protein
MRHHLEIPKTEKKVPARANTCLREREREREVPKKQIILICEKTLLEKSQSH